MKDLCISKRLCAITKESLVVVEVFDTNLANIFVKVRQVFVRLVSLLVSGENSRKFPARYIIKIMIKPSIYKSLGQS